MPDDLITAPDVTAELSMVLDESRRLLASIWAREDHAYAMDYMLYHADRLQLTLHNLFGDAIPAPRPLRETTIEPEPAAVTPPVHRRRVVRFRRLALAVA